MEWQARWVWAESRSSTPNFYLYARREFDLAGAVNARVFVTCSSEYKLYINGKPIGRGPGPCDPPARQYDEYDVAHAVRPGRNVIAALCYNYGVATSFLPQAPGGFFLQAEFSNSHEALVIATDESWKVKAADDWDFGSSRMSPTTGFQEVCDSRKKPVGWNVVGFDDSAWEDAAVLGEAGTDLIPRDIPALREHEVFPERVVRSVAVQYAKSALNASGETAAVAPGRDAFITLDFGREVVGFPVIRVRDGSPTAIDIGYSRELDEAGNVILSAAKNLGSQKQILRCAQNDMSHIVVQADSVFLHGGRQEWEPFGRRAFRYMQLTFRGASAPLHLESVAIRAIGYPVSQVSTFECSDESLNDAWREGMRALGLSMQDNYESCPLRQREQSADGAAVQALTNYYCFFDTVLAAKTLRRFSARPDSSLAWICMLHDYYLHTGDRSLVLELFPNVKIAVERGAPRDAFGYQVLRDAAKLAITSAAIDESVEWMAQAEGICDRAKGTARSQTHDGGIQQLRDLANAGDENAALDLLRGEEFRKQNPFAATYFLPAEILGVRPSMPESGVVVIQPRPSDLQWAKGHIKTHSSTVDVEWTFEPGLFRLDINAPEGFIVALPVRGFRNPRIDEIDLDPDTPERRARKTYGWSDTIWREGEEHDPYMDWLKTQESEPPAHYQRKKRVSTEEQYVWVTESAVTHVRYEIREGPVSPL